jgi:hypothetical protein
MDAPNLPPVPSAPPEAAPSTSSVPSIPPDVVPSAASQATQEAVLSNSTPTPSPANQPYPLAALLAPPELHKLFYDTNVLLSLVISLNDEGRVPKLNSIIVKEERIKLFQGASSRVAAGTKVAEAAMGTLVINNEVLAVIPFRDMDGCMVAVDQGNFNDELEVEEELVDGNEVDSDGSSEELQPAFQMPVRKPRDDEKTTLKDKTGQPLVPRTAHFATTRNPDNYATRVGKLELGSDVEQVDFGRYALLDRKGGSSWEELRKLPDEMSVLHVFLGRCVV